MQYGTLYRLEGDPTTAKSRSRRVEYYWLCEGCALTMTLRLGDDGTVTTAALPPALRATPPGVDVALSHRKHGWLLRTVDARLSSRDNDRTRRRPMHGRHAA